LRHHGIGYPSSSAIIMDSTKLRRGILKHTNIDKHINLLISINNLAASPTRNIIHVVIFGH